MPFRSVVLIWWSSLDLYTSFLCVLLVEIYTWRSCFSYYKRPHHVGISLLLWIFPMRVITFDVPKMSVWTFFSGISKIPKFVLLLVIRKTFLLRLFLVVNKLRLFWELLWLHSHGLSLLHFVFFVKNGFVLVKLGPWLCSKLDCKFFSKYVIVDISIVVFMQSIDIKVLSFPWVGFFVFNERRTQLSKTTLSAFEILRWAFDY
jgi:hypothetical protein